MSDMPERRAVTKKKVETAIKKWCHPEGDITWTEKSITCVDEDGKEITIKFKPDTSRAVTFRLLFDYIKGLDAAEYLDAEVDYGEDEPEVEEEEEAGEGDEDDKGGGVTPTARLPTEAVAVSRFERLSYSRLAERVPSDARLTRRGRGGPRRPR